MLTSKLLSAWCLSNRNPKSRQGNAFFMYWGGRCKVMKSTGTSDSPSTACALVPPKPKEDKAPVRRPVPKGTCSLWKIWWHQQHQNSYNQSKPSETCYLSYLPSLEGPKASDLHVKVLMTQNKMVGICQEWPKAHQFWLACLRSILWKIQMRIEWIEMNHRKGLAALQTLQSFNENS